MATIATIIKKLKDESSVVASQVTKLTEKQFDVNAPFTDFVNAFLDAEKPDTPFNTNAAYPGSWHSVASYALAFKMLCEAADSHVLIDVLGQDMCTSLKNKAISMKKYVSKNQKQFGIEPVPPGEKKTRKRPTKAPQPETVAAETTGVSQDDTESAASNDSFVAEVGPDQLLVQNNALKEANQDLIEHIQKLKEVIKKFKLYFARNSTPEVAVLLDVIDVSGI